MKNQLIYLLVAMCIAACTNMPEKSTELSDTIPTAGESVSPNAEGNSQTSCFQKLAGNSNQDTTKLKLMIDGQSVRGEFGHYPKEKDKRVGKITATKDGELIKGIWTYMQEGMNDTLQVEFKLSGDKLSQKNYTIDSKTGREVISASSAFNIEFQKIPCPN